MPGETFKSASERFAELCDLVRQLRDPQHGCPWDLEQDHGTLAKYIVEEAYEAASVMREHDSEKICDELGDVLFQVVLNSQVANDEKKFHIEDVIQNVYTKMHRRHPHVFGSAEDKSKREIPQIMKRWEEIKASEKDATGSSYMREKGVHKVFPASTQAYKIGKAARSINFDWKKADEVFDVLLSEIQELKNEWKASQKSTPELRSEIGDVYFTLAQLCRHLDMEPEMVATEGNQKFLKRFECMEDIAKIRGQKISDLQESDLEILWKKAKEKVG